MQDVNQAIPSKLRIVFGLIMAAVYIAVGVLLIINFFGWTNDSAWVFARYVVGIILIIYGFFRGYRAFI